jgi:cytochrome c oxidase subunit 2
MIIPLGSKVLFDTSSIDVNHGLGLYSAQGQLLDQVQVMSGCYNNIIYQFTKPGTYYVRCLEFCGYGHFGMVTQFVVSWRTVLTVGLDESPFL